MEIAEKEIKEKLNSLHEEMLSDKEKLSDEENKYIEKDFISIKELFETRYGKINKRRSSQKR